MILFRQSINIVLCTLAIYMLLPDGIGQAEESASRVLVIRPEKLAETAISQQIAALPRNPFNWSPGQIKEFRSIEKRQKADPFTGLELKGIIWNKEQPLAIINDRLVGKGDTIKDAYIREISSRQVVLESMGRYHTLKISSKIINLGGVKE